MVPAGCPSAASSRSVGIRAEADKNRRGDMNIEYKVEPRRAVLRKLGLSSLTNTAPFDIAAAHEALVQRQAVPERIETDGLTVDVPAGVYHPLPDSSSEFFIRNIRAMDEKQLAKTCEIGCGCGIISLFIAKNWQSDVVAADISPVAVQATLDNARLNNVSLTAIESDLFDNIEE